MKKFYLMEQDRNEEEKRTGKASYASIINRFFKNLVLCNDIVKVDYELEDVIGKQYDEESEEYVDIYQYFITDIPSWSLEYLQELVKDNNDDSILLLYSNVLNCYVLAVTHFGTGWSYVPTNIALTESHQY